MAFLLHSPKGPSTARNCASGLASPNAAPATSSTHLSLSVCSIATAPVNTVNTLGADLYLDPRKEGYIGGLFENLNAREYPMLGYLDGGAAHRQAADGMSKPSSILDRSTPIQNGLLRFAKAMTGASLAPAKVIAARFPWDRYETFADVGTAQGCLPVQIALAQPHVSGNGFDLPIMETTFDRYVKDHGVSDRVRLPARRFLRRSTACG